MAMIVCTIVAGVLSVFGGGNTKAIAMVSYLSGACAWGAGFLLLHGISAAQRVQVGCIATLGLILILYASTRDGSIEWFALLIKNAQLLSMIGAVGFLKLIAVASASDLSRAVTGGAAYFKTLLGVSILGSVINISAPIIIADRLTQTKPLSSFASQSITRVFSGCSSWSPFFAGMAAVLIYVPQADLPFLMVACFPFAIIGFFAVTLEAHFRYRQKLANFSGYALQPGNLWIPGSLAMLVIFLNTAFDSLSILVSIASASLLLSVVALLLKKGVQTAVRTLTLHIGSGLPQMRNELLLFLSAGVLAVGLAAIISTNIVVLPEFRFNAWFASVVLAVTLLLACCGIHPLIMLAATTPLLVAHNPEPNLLATTYLLGWSLGTCASPLSGTHLVFQGRYGVTAWRAAVRNWPFAVLMYGVAVVILIVVDGFL